MKVKLIKQSPVTNDELSDYNNKISKLKGIGFTSHDVDMDKRIVTLRLVEDTPLTLVNPIVTEKSDKLVLYFEKDSNKEKTRKTIRHTSFKVNTDNLGIVEFSADNETWKTEKDLMEDMGLFECILAQRLIDAIDGIDINSELRRYTTQVISTKQPGRNDKVMLQGPDGDMAFIKFKNAQSLISKGYQLV
jgi:hypothetical protein